MPRPDHLASTIACKVSQMIVILSFILNTTGCESPKTHSLAQLGNADKGSIVRVHLEKNLLDADFSSTIRWNATRIPDVSYPNGRFSYSVQDMADSHMVQYDTCVLEVSGVSKLYVEVCYRLASVGRNASVQFWLPADIVMKGDMIGPCAYLIQENVKYVGHDTWSYRVQSSLSRESLIHSVPYLPVEYLEKDVVVVAGYEKFYLDPFHFIRGIMIDSLRIDEIYPSLTY